MCLTTIAPVKMMDQKLMLYLFVLTSTCIRHAQPSSAVMFQFEVLIRKLLAINGPTTGAVSELDL